MIRGIREHLSSIIRDIVYVYNEIQHHKRFDLSTGEGTTNAVFHILRKAGTLKPGRDPSLVVCWGGHSISVEEYKYTKKVGHELGLRNLDICTGCGPGVMKGPMKGATIAHAKQRIVEGQPYPWILLVVAVLAVVFAVLLHFSTFGRGVFEIGLNDEAARFSGVDVARTKLVLFVLAGTISAFAGVYYTLRYGSARGDNATGMELQVIAAVLLGGVSIFGGRGALHGVLAGVLLIGVVTSAMRFNTDLVDKIQIVVGVLLVLSVVSPSFLSWASGLIRGRTGLRSRSTAGTGKRSLP